MKCYDSLIELKYRRATGYASISGHMPSESAAGTFDFHSKWNSGLTEL